MELPYKSLCVILGVVLLIAIREGETPVCFYCLHSLYLCLFIGLAIKCWDCRSDADPKCADPFDNTTFAISDCQQAPLLEHLNNMPSTMCRKIRQKCTFCLQLFISKTIIVLFTVNGVWKYIRSCAYLGEVGMYGDERYCLMRTGTYNIFMEYCTCNSKDGCNGTSALKHSPFVTFVLLVFVPFVYRIMR